MYPAPCFCPFHEKFEPLKSKFFSYTKGPTFQFQCRGKYMVYPDRDAFKVHCDVQKDWQHFMLKMYLDNLYPKKKVSKKKSGNR